MSEPISADHDAYLRSHGWAIVATTRSNGAPQASLVAYHYDGVDLVVSTRERSAKVRNLRRRPDTVFVVADDRQFLSVVGRVEIIDREPELLELTLRLQRSLGPSDTIAAQVDIDAGLEAVGRVILRLIPQQILGRI